MIGKVTIDLSRRTVGSLGLLCNRLTPARRSREVIDRIGRLSGKMNVKISVELDGLYLDAKVKIIHIPSSEAYARCLKRAGVLEFEIRKGTGPKLIKRILDALSDRGLEKAKSILKDRSIQTDCIPTLTIRTPSSIP